MGINNPLIDALKPLTSRVRRDVTAIRRNGKQAWTRDPLTRERMAAHLNGGPARGVCPIKAGESVTMVAILDFDSHKGEITWPEMAEIVGRVVCELEARSMEPILFRSSGGNGCHIYLIWAEAQDAYSVREFLREVLEACGLRDGAGGLKAGQCEVFPRQSEVAANGFGNQVTLPLAAKSVPLLLTDEEEPLW